MQGRMLLRTTLQTTKSRDIDLLREREIYFVDLDIPQVPLSCTVELKRLELFQR